MLKLQNIKKSYKVGETVTEALKGISISFRKSEFVAILGQSGCGKTTLLNVIGGLDHYDSGDLVINGVSTKQYKDADWDRYRNHSIGFVFQSYNLIPHQTVLANVELALSLCGVSKAERKRRAIQALTDVGLSDQLYKKPTEMSGGQMQRVAIARALVNNPDIILADEPTGALDSETSVQVMEILKEVAKDRLVIMVTHNPELADAYATRTVRMLDGVITSDSAPITEEEALRQPDVEAKTEKGKGKKSKRPSMSLLTAFGLSLKNLFTKKGRTALTSFAGSIGIIGIALIFAVSQGTTAYINTMQEDTLSSYPLTLESQHLDIGSLLLAFINEAESNGTHENDAVYQKAMFYNLVNALSAMESNENDLKSFKKYLEDERSKPESESGLSEAINGIQYTYDLNMLIYTENIDGNIIQSDSQKLMQELLLEYFGLNFTMSGGSASGSNMMSSNMMTMGGGAKLWQEILPGDNGKPINPLLEKQYDVIYGSWPNSYDEIVLVVDQNNEIDDMTLYALGLKSKEDIDALAHAAFNKEKIETTHDRWTFEEICNMEFRTILPADCYVYDEVTGCYSDLRETQTGLKVLYSNGTKLRISGIIRPSEDAVSSMLTGSIGYTNKLTEYVIEKSKDSAAIKAQLASPKTDIFTNLPFPENTKNLSDSEKIEEFKKHISELDTKEKAKTYISIKSTLAPEEIDKIVNDTLSKMDREQMEATLMQIITAQMSMSESDVKGYLEAMSDKDMNDLFAQMIAEQTKAKYAEQIKQQLASLNENQLATLLDTEMALYTKEQLVLYYNEVMEFSKSSFDANLKALGCVELDDPSSINIYASSFEKKDVIEEAILAYNERVGDLEKISYTDYVGLMMSSITTIINAITYVLIAFVAISLIVSSIMIGVITLISVQERTKEIGILRAIGASKRNVSSMFNAETVIIGFISGLLGVGVTYLLCIPINAILHAVTDINNLNAVLPVPIAIALVSISVLLTLFAGIIPSASAAKKDPVVALRTE